MTAPTKVRPPVWSGFCGLRLGPASHQRCRGSVAGLPCACTCHQTCPTCGQNRPATTQEPRQ